MNEQIIKIKEKIDSENISKNFFFFMIGTLLCAIGVSVFYNPNNVVTSGSTGLAILINKFINIDLSLVVFALSSFFLVTGFVIFGVEYGSKNLFGTIIYPIFIKAATLINLVVNFKKTSLFLIIIIGSVIYGIGFGIIKRSGYSLGGLNVLYDYLNKKFKISIGKANLLVNIIIIIFSIFAFGIDKCIYAAIGLYFSSSTLDKVMLGISRNKAFYIITKKPLDVRDYIIENLKHTVTIVNAKGGYSNKKKKLLLCVIPTTEYIKLKDVVKEIDKDAFFLITDSYSISK